MLNLLQIDSLAGINQIDTNSRHIRTFMPGLYFMLLACCREFRQGKRPEIRSGFFYLFFNSFDSYKRVMPSVLADTER